MPSHTVLVVEDDQDLRETLLELFESYGYEAVGAMHGREALDKLDALGLPPSVIVLDLMMPGMDGWSFPEEQLKKPAVLEVPVIVISAYDAVPYQVQDLRPAAYLKKPINVQDLMSVVQRH